MSHKTIRVAVLFLSILLVLQTANGDVPGDLHVIGERGVSIYVDGDLVGMTDENGFSMGMLEGEYVIRAEKDGELIYTSTFIIESGETTEIAIPGEE